MALRIAVAGGGPGGLFLASLLKRASPDHEIVVFERNPAGATYGFGVAFSDLSLSYLDESDPELQRELVAGTTRWEHLEVRHRGEAVRAYGHPLSAIGRATLLSLLQSRADEAGVVLHFEHDHADPAQLVDEYDLVVGADGVNSSVRAAYADELGASVEMGRSKYIWFGSDTEAPEIFEGLTFAFEENGSGPFGVHGYPFKTPEGVKTAFIIETDPATWRRAGLDRNAAQRRPPGEGDLDSMRFCDELFREHLKGHTLVSNNSQWMEFPTVRCRRWHHGSVVVIGDAAHTAHFSLGSGTKLAMEDAIVLAREIANATDIATALTAYERARRPDVERLQYAAEPSRMWWERFRHYTGFTPRQFAFHCFSRTGIMTYGRLGRRDPEFIRGVEEWFAGADDTGRGDGPAILQRPLRLGAITLPNRVLAYGGGEGSSAAAGAASGAGLVIAGPYGYGVGRDELARVVDEVRSASRALAGIELHGPPGDPQAVLAAARAACDAGADLVALRVGGAALTGDPAQRDGVLQLLRDARAAIPDSTALMVVLAVARTSLGDDALETLGQVGAELRQAGCDLVGVALAGDDPPLDHMSVGSALALICDALRNPSGVATAMLTGVEDDDQATTYVLSTRMDLCVGAPGATA